MIAKQCLDNGDSGPTWVSQAKKFLPKKGFPHRKKFLILTQK